MIWSAHTRTSSCPLRRSLREGFTAVEIVIAVMILGLVAALTVPKYRTSICRHRVEAAARRIIADLQWAQQQAIATSASRLVQFAPATESYTLAGMKDIDRANQVYAVDLDEHPYSTDLVSADFSGTTSLTYDGFGRASSGGTIVVRVGQQQKTVTVDPQSGKAAIP